MTQNTCKQTNKQTAFNALRAAGGHIDLKLSYMRVCVCVCSTFFSILLEIKILRA